MLARDSGLEVRGVSRQLGGRSVLEDVSLRLQPGEVVGLLGPNGAGKSTLFRIIMGLLRPEGGRVFLDGEDITSLATHRRARAGLGYLPQEPSAFLGLTARENLEAVLEQRRRPRSEAGPFLEALGLTARAGQRASTLSGGERRRLEIARLLALRPRLLLLDEPLRGIDPRGLDRLDEALSRLVAEGAGVLLTDHPRPSLSGAPNGELGASVLALCRRVHVLIEGRLVASGTPEEMAIHPLAQRLYFRPQPGPAGGVSDTPSAPPV